MFTIAAELNIVAELPFFLTWFTTGIGEFASLIIGAIIIGKIGRPNRFKQIEEDKLGSLYLAFFLIENF